MKFPVVTILSSLAVLASIGDAAHQYKCVPEGKDPGPNGPKRAENGECRQYLTDTLEFTGVKQQCLKNDKCVNDGDRCSMSVWDEVDAKQTVHTWYADCAGETMSSGDDVHYKCVPEGIDGKGQKVAQNGECRQYSSATSQFTGIKQQCLKKSKCAKAGDACTTDAEDDERFVQYSACAQ